MDRNRQTSHHLQAKNYLMRQQKQSLLASDSLVVVFAVQHSISECSSYYPKSSVSGGGYTNGWLSAWIHRSGFEAVDDVLRSDADGLGTQERWAKQHPIHHLRCHSSYLMPRPEFFSGDSWAAVSIYLRNLILNLATLISWMVSALLMPHFVVNLAYTIAAFKSRDLNLYGWLQLVLVAVLVFLAGLTSITILLVTLKAPIFLAESLARLNPLLEETPVSPKRLGHAGVIKNLLIPVGVLSCFLTAFLAAFRISTSLNLFLFVSCVAFIYFSVWWIANNSDCEIAHSKPALYFSAGLSGTCVGVMLVFIGHIFWIVTPGRELLLRTVMVGPPVIATVLLAGSILQIGLVGISFDDPHLSKATFWQAGSL
jgi:hypothetical protein